MGFGDLKSPSGLETLNAYLADKSYIEGFQPSQADAVVFNALSKAPDAKFVNALRWYNHINSYGAGRTSFPGQKKDLTSYGPSGSGTNAATAADDDDDDVDLFGSDEEEDEEYLKEKQRRVEEYNIKKAQKKQVIAKSNVILDVKPWDDETDMKAMEKAVRSIKADGLVWGASKLVPVGYGINKLQITIVIEDDKISTDWLEEQITGFEDYVQSMDIAAFNKI